MANHAYIISKNPITFERLEELFQEVNTERFEGKLPIQIDEENQWIISLINDYNSFVEMRIPTDNFEQDCIIEIRHGHGAHISWYTDFYITHAIAEKLNAKIMDDGDGKIETPCFHTKYPRFKDYVEASYIKRFYPMLKPMEKELAGEYWKVL